MPPVAYPNPFLRTSQPPRRVAVIPARYQSTRLPGKPLADIGGRPMIEHVYRRVADTRGIDATIVATDDMRIAAAVEAFGGVARITATTHQTGTDRIAEVLRELECEIVVNVQGDLPLIEPGLIAELCGVFEGAPQIQMATVRRRMTDAREYRNPNVVKVAVAANGDALYFSRATIPFVRDEQPATDESLTRRPIFKHIGLYAYRRDFLLALAALPPTPLELSESLEQLRALERGFSIRTVETSYESVEVDTPEDLERVRRQIAVSAHA